MTMTKRPKDPTLVDVDMEPFNKLIGVPFGGDQPRYPLDLSDIRRWATHTDNYNPLHFDADWAAASRFGQIVAAQSYMGIRSIGESTYMLSPQPMNPYHAADEQWFYGPRVYAGDQYRLDRVMSGARATNTRYGPSVFVTVDTTYNTARGIVMKRRSTTLLHPTANQVTLGDRTIAGMSTEEPEWTDEQIEEIIDKQLDYIRSWRNHDKRLFGSVKVGDKLPRYIIGPHSGATFVYGEASDLQDVWGSTYVPADQPPPLPVRSMVLATEGYTFEKFNDPERKAFMPMRRGWFEMREGRGGHIYNKSAIRRGMPRAFGVGTMETVWATDYLANWAGEWGFVRHMTIRYTLPILSGDLTYIDGVVTGVEPGPAGFGTVHISYTFDDQNGLRLALGIGDIELPLA